MNVRTISRERVSRRGFGLTAKTTALLDLLRESGADGLTSEQMARALYGASDADDRRAAHELIFRLRRGGVRIEATYVYRLVESGS